jgi:hypothetical protein
MAMGYDMTVVYDLFLSYIWFTAFHCVRTWRNHLRAGVHNKNHDRTEV